MTGFIWENERPDMQLAHDKNESQIRENKYRDMNRDIPVAEYTNNGVPITKILKDMIEKDSMRSLWYKHQVFWDVEDIHEALSEVCIKLALGDEEFAAYLNDKGEEIEIVLQ